MLETPGISAFTPLVAVGGNSRAARSARARLQWRDRFGRWVEMGRGVKFKLRRSNGTVLSVTGTFVGAIDEDTGSVYVKGDTNGFKDGFYRVNSSNGQEILASLDQGYLDKRGIEAGKDVDGGLVGDRTEADIQNEDDSTTFSEAPEGWTKSGNVFETDDKEFKATQNQDGTLTAQHNGAEDRPFKDWPEVIETIDAVDDGSEDWSAPQAQDESAPQQPQEPAGDVNDPAATDASGIDTDTFDVAREGFLVPTAKKGSTSDLPGFVEANKDFLGEGGKRLVIDSDTGEVEIYNSADTLDNAKAQAGGIGVPDFIDLSTGQRVSTGETVAPSPEQVKETPNVEDRSADPVEPDPVDAGPDQPVDEPSAEPRPAGDDPAGDPEPAPTDNDALGQPIPADRAGLEQRIAFLERATQRVSPDSDQFDATYQARDQIQERLNSFDEKLDEIQDSVDEIKSDQTQDRIADLENQLQDLKDSATVSDSTPTGNEDERTAEPEPAGDGGGSPDLPEGVQPSGGDGRADSGSEAPRANLGRKIDRPERWDALEAMGLATPDLYELEQTPENAERFHAGISKLKENNPYAPSVYVYSPEEYGNMRMFLTEDGTAGVAIKDGDEMVSGFVHGDSPHKGAFRSVLSAAIAEGGVRGDAFDTILPHLYAQEGFVPVARQKFADEFAPEGWNYDTFSKYNGGRPDVVFLQYKPERVDSKYVPGEGVEVTDYDDGLAIARGLDPATTPDLDVTPEIDAPAAPEQNVAEADLAPVEPKPVSEMDLSELSVEAYGARQAMTEAGARRDWAARDAAKRRFDTARFNMDRRDESFPMGEFAPGDEIAYYNITGRRYEGTVVRQNDDGTYTVDHGQRNYKQTPQHVNVKPRSIERPNGIVPRQEEEETAVDSEAELDRAADELREADQARYDEEARAEAELDRIANEQRDADQAMYDLENQKNFEELRAELDRIKNAPVDVVDFGNPNRSELDRLIADDRGSSINPDREMSPEDRDRLATLLAEQRDREISETIRSDVSEAEPAELPDDIAELERMAASLERRIEMAREARKPVLEREVDAIYDRIDSLKAAQTPEPDPEVVEEAPIPESEPLPEPISFENFTDEVESAPVFALIEGKNIPEEQASELREELTRGVDRPRLNEIKSDLSERGNKPNTATKPRPSNQNRTTVNDALLETDNDPTTLVDPNLIIQDVKRNHPDFTLLDNGDTVIETRTVGNKRYDLAIRRTPREEFFAYIKETDLNTGAAQGVRLRRGNHSYKGLLTQINTGKMALGNDPLQWVRKRRGSAEVIPSGQELSSGPLGDYIDSTNLPRTEDEMYNNLVKGIAELAEDPDTSRKMLNEIAALSGYNAKLIDTILGGVRARKAQDLYESEMDTRPSHVSYGGVQLKEGDWVDWTDSELTVPVKDEEGNTVYQRDADGAFVLNSQGKRIAENMPNPNYGKVYRGQVRNLQYKTKGGAYVYSDSTNVSFYDWNAEMGMKPSYQRPRVSSKLQVVDARDTPLSEPFFSKEEEHQRPQNIVARPSAEDFGVPTVDVGTTPRAGAPAAPTVFEPVATRNGLAHPDHPDVPLPGSAVEAAQQLTQSVQLSGESSEILPGDIMTLGGLNSEEWTVVDVQPLPTFTEVMLSRKDGEEYVSKTLQLERTNEFVVNRPNAAPTDGADFDPDDFIHERDRKMMLQAVRERKMSKAAETRFERALKDPFLTGETVEDMWAEINTLKLKKEPEGSDVATARKVLAGSETPEGVEAAAVSERDAERFDGPGDRIYGGYSVKPIAVKDFAPVRGESITDQFTIIQLGAGQLRAGDIIQQDSISGSYFAQVLSAKPQNVGDSFNKTTEIHVRTIMPEKGSHMEYKAKTTRFGRPEDGWLGSAVIGNWIEYKVHRPTSTIAKDYFRDPADVPAPLPPRAFTAPAGAPDNPEIMKDIERRTSGLLASYNDGFESDNKRSTRVGEGQMHIEAAIGTTSDGSRVFTKVVGEEDNYTSEVTAAAVYNVIGGKGLYTVGEIIPETDDEDRQYRLIMTAIDGKNGGEDMPYISQAFKDMADGREDVVQLGLLDYITNMGDRNPGNYRIERGTGLVIPIDNEFAFGSAPDSPFAETLLELLREGRAPITSAQLLRLKNNLGMLRGMFSKFEMDRQFDQMLSRVDRLIDGVNGHGI